MQFSTLFKKIKINVIVPLLSNGGAIKERTEQTPECSYMSRDGIWNNCHTRVIIIMWYNAEKISSQRRPAVATCFIIATRKRSTTRETRETGQPLECWWWWLVMIPFNENVVLLSTVKTRHCLITRYMAYYVAQIIIISCFIIEWNGTPCGSEIVSPLNEATIGCCSGSIGTVNALAAEEEQRVGSGLSWLL